MKLQKNMQRKVDNNGVCAVYTIHGAVNTFFESYISLIRTSNISCTILVDDSELPLDKRMLVNFFRTRNECLQLLAVRESLLPLGYTKSINIGIKSALRYGCKYIAQVNSDTS